MINLLDLSYEELSQFIEGDLNEPPRRTEQIWKLLWQKRIKDITKDKGLHPDFQKRLSTVAVNTRPEIVETQKSQDGTVKFLLRLHDGECIETVLIPMRGSYSQCLSTQVGCAMGCTFCNTGQLGFTRNLSVGEILGQILVGKDYLLDNSMPALKNLVFMGMGEPLMNFNNLVKALHMIPSESGLSISWRRSQVSTVGIPHRLVQLGKMKLSIPAISLHAPNQKLRESIMPIAKRYPLEDLMAAIDAYPLGSRDRIVFEYLLLKGVNDSLETADELGKLLQGRHAKVNLISYNATEGMPYKTPSEAHCEAFLQQLRKYGLTVFLRRSMGDDISAACGQLRAAENDSATLK
ncbi:MAG: 23S rRNA (adenine(2503)-C(2))-methyltransferase RlmN [Desulfovibrio sp.]